MAHLSAFRGSSRSAQRWITSTSRGQPGRIIASLESSASHAQPHLRPSGPMSQQVLQTATTIFTFARKTALATAVAGGLVGMITVGSHVYVEFGPLSDTSSPDQDAYGWYEEWRCAHGWGTSNDSKGEGTLRIWERWKVRRAWIYKNWQHGWQTVTMMDGGGVKLVDAAQIKTLQLLDSVLKSLRERGISIESNFHRNVTELELRRADTLELIATQDSLLAAYKSYQRIWESCVVEAERNGSQSSWRVGEALRVCQKIVDTNSKLEREREGCNDRSREILAWAATTGLKFAFGDGQIFRDALSLEQQKVSKESRSSKLTTPEIEVIVASLQALTPSSSSSSAPLMASSSQVPHGISQIPASIVRQTVSSILRLSTLLVETPETRPAAFALQSSLLTLLRNIPTSSTMLDVESMFQSHWLQTRQALASVYAAEVGRSIGTIGSDEAVKLCLEALAMCEQSIGELSTDTIPSTQKGDPKLQISNQAKTTGAMAANLIGIIHEVECPSLNDDEVGRYKKPWWCVGNDGKSMAASFFKIALGLGQDNFVEEEAKRNFERVNQKKLE